MNENGSVRFTGISGDSKIGTKGTGKIEGMPPIVQSRVNLRNGSAAEGVSFNHVLDRHFNPSKNASQFSTTPDELKGVLEYSSFKSFILRYKVSRWDNREAG
ncbi:hypothetical protein ASG66_02700 [Bacillus sp. Leaf406]|nr:hypothetical protein ASG66_02700 [Bacillus sp. Leaf406]